MKTWPLPLPFSFLAPRLPQQQQCLRLVSRRSTSSSFPLTSRWMLWAIEMLMILTYSFIHSVNIRGHLLCTSPAPGALIQQRTGLCLPQAYKLDGETEHSCNTGSRGLEPGPRDTGSTNQAQGELAGQGSRSSVVRYGDIQHHLSPARGPRARDFNPQPQFPTLWSRDNNFLSLLILLRGLNETRRVKCFATVPSTQ